MSLLLEVLSRVWDELDLKRIHDKTRQLELAALKRQEKTRQLELAELNRQKVLLELGLPPNGVIEGLVVLPTNEEIEGVEENGDEEEMDETDLVTDETSTPNGTVPPDGNLDELDKEAKNGKDLA